MILFYPTKNDFLRKLYFDSLLAHRKDLTPIYEDHEIKSLRNETVLLDAEHLIPNNIDFLKHNQNKLVAFDINDNSCFCYSYQGNRKILDVDMIFKVAGIQKPRQSMNTLINNNLIYSAKHTEFMNDEDWDIYSILKDENRIYSLPYVLWDCYEVPNVPFSSRKNKVLVRGGHHYLRVHLLFNLIYHGMVDENSIFNTKGYIGQYCPNCQEVYKKGWMSFDDVASLKSECKLEKPLPPGYFQDRGDWNNGCPSRYFEIADLLGLEKKTIENVLNGSYVLQTDFYDILNKYTMYSDLKWIFSIYIPPRFWEAAAAHTVNFLPYRTSDQEFFPEVTLGDHYLGYKENFSDLDRCCDLEESIYKYIVDNTYDLYDKWIKRGEFPVNTNLLNHIMEKIELRLT